MQAVISSFPHFSQTSARRLSFAHRLYHRHRPSTTINGVHQYTSSLTSNALRLVISLHPTQLTSYVFAVAASMHLSVLASTTRLPLTNIPYVTRPSSASNDEHTSKLYPVTTQFNHNLFEIIASLNHGRFPASPRTILALRTHLISAVYGTSAVYAHP
jgi:hypothetical protein